MTKDQKLVVRRKLLRLMTTQELQDMSGLKRPWIVDYPALLDTCQSDKNWSGELVEEKFASLLRMANAKEDGHAAS